MNNETTTTATPRTKSQLRYAIKTKVFHENRQDLLKRCLELASEWNTFGKTSWLYKHNGYVAGADFDTEARDFNYYLKINGTIVRRGGHTSWQRIH